MEEHFDIVDENNNIVGDKKLRSEAHATGLWHRVVHIYIFRVIGEEIEIIVHLRSKTKDLHPNCWDTRFGGHIKTGETVEETLQAELMEEVGLVLEPENLVEGEIYKRDKYPNREFTYSFYYNFSGDISTLKFNDGEVQEIKWMKISDILRSMTGEPETWAGGLESFNKVVEVLKNKINIL